jgi:hypothetical protein
MLPRRAALIGLVLLLLAIACGGPSTRLVTVRSPTGSGSVDFTVKNLSSAGINTFHLAKTERVNQTGKEHVDPNTPEGAALWGPDLLGAAIGSGQSQPVKVPEPGNWDARAVDRDGREQLITRLHLGAGGRYILELYDGGWRVYSD